MELITYCCMSCQDRCSHVFIYPVTPALVYSQNPLGIANLAGRDFGFFYCLIVYIHSTAVHLQPKVRLRHTLDLLRAVRELMPLSAVLMRAYAVDGHWAESVHLRIYTNFKPKSPPDKLTQFQRIVLTIH